MKRIVAIVRFVAIAGGLCLLAVIGVAVGARFADGPIAIFPGGPLVSGTPTEYEAVDWSRVAHLRELEFQLEDPPRSRTAWFSVHNGVPYIPCAFCTNHLLKHWPRELEHDDRVVLRVGGMLIKGRAHRVANDSPEYAAAKETHRLKYSQQSGARAAAEGRAAGAVVGAARLAPGVPRLRRAGLVALSD